MRRLPYIVFVLAAALSTACSPHEFPGGDPERDFSLKMVFDDELPAHQLITPTKAGEAAQPRYTVLLWRYVNGTAFEAVPDYTFTFTRPALSDLDTTIYLPIRPAKYRIAGWVDWVGADAGSGYELSDPERIMLPADYSFGEHAREAYTFVMDYDVEGCYVAGETYQKAITLRLPVAQLRIVAPEALTFLAMTGVDPSEMLATLRYGAALPDGYDILQGKTGTSRSDVVLTGMPRYDTSGEMVFLSDFILMADTLMEIPVEFTLADRTGRQLIVYSGNIPIRLGRTTTISFDMPYGGDDKPGGIGIDPGFDDEIEIIID